MSQQIEQLLAQADTVAGQALEDVARRGAAG